MRLLPLAFVYLLATPALSQSPAPDPQVNPDRTVSFHYTAPAATKVEVSIEGVKAPLLLQKDVAGMWSGNSPVLAPAIYGYSFQVDGTTQIDPANLALKTGYLGIGNSFLVPGTPPAPWEAAAIPHGVLHHHAYTTGVVLGLDRNQSEFYVYTPPGYDPHGTIKYPVLYLLHGWSDNASGWSSFGHANDILDSLIAQGKARPMIVVMPLGYGDMSFVLSGHDVWRDVAAIKRNTDLFTKALLTEILPQVERLYNVSSRREDRAIAGLSMGGLESLSIGLNHSDQFSFVGGFSSAVHLFDQTYFPTAPLAVNNLKLLWIACGTSDDLITPNRRLTATLKAEGYPVTAIETPGAHSWMVWRDNLVHFAPLLFPTK